MDLKNKKCKPCEGGTPPLEGEALENARKQIDKAWEVSPSSKSIQKTFLFKNYYQTMAFVNAIAWMAHQEDHHPDLVVCYDHCKVTYSTHSIDGLSESDFICAAKIDALLTDA